MGHFETQAIHAGYEPSEHGYAAVPPIYLSAAFDLANPARGDALSAGTADGFAYSRVANPTVSLFEQRIAALEGGSSAVAFASGMGAVSSALLCVAEGGGHIIAPKNLYGASMDALETFFPQFGITTSFVDDINDLAHIGALITPNTRAIFAESVANPSTHVTDVASLAQFAHAHGIPVIIDNTLATPYLYQPIHWGADIVVHSTTKGISGHGNALGGIVVDAGNFDWSSTRFAHLNQTELVVSDEYADEWHSFVSRYGKDAFIARVRIKYLRTFGAVPSPFSSYLQSVGVETLAVRVREQVRTATAIAQYLQTNPHVRNVYYSGLALHSQGKGEQARIVRTQYSRGIGQVLSFEIQGTREQAVRIIEHTQLFAYAPNIGDARSLIVDPARITHREVSAEFRKATGVTDTLLRLSVGLEDVNDLIADLDQAIRAAFDEV